MPATHVYANGHEIAAKAVGSAGTSSSASPDPCWSPPAPAAGPVVVPYPNTVFATTITNGTRTVCIAGMEAGIADESYFGSSTGNEPATQAFAKGVATGVITGKGYFTQWSHDVIFEGFGVPRDLDLVGHNHGSMPSNTPVFPYVSRSFLFGHPCSAEEKRIERACAPEKGHSEARSALKKQSKLSRLLRARRGDKSKHGRRDGNGWHWTDDHCEGLEVPLDAPERAREYAKKMEEAFKALPDELKLLDALRDELKDIAVNAGTKASLKWGGKAALKQAAGTSLPAIGNAAMALWSVADAAVAIGDVSEIRAVATEALEKLDVLRNKATDLQRAASEFADFSKLSPDEQLQKAQALATDGQDMLATLNDCTRARKCNLVPYSADGSGNLLRQRGRSKVESASGGGCCNGQTGHHLIPGGSVKDNCPNYDHATAPTVCVEGTSQNMGSHKRAHQALARMHQAKLRKGRVAADGTMSMDDAIDSAADSHQEAFPLSNCSKKCIKAQLESYYAVCRGSRVQAVNAQAKPLGPTPGGGNGPSD